AWTKTCPFSNVSGASPLRTVTQAESEANTSGQSAQRAVAQPISPTFPTPSMPHLWVAAMVGSSKRAPAVENGRDHQSFAHLLWMNPTRGRVCVSLDVRRQCFPGFRPFGPLTWSGIGSELTRFQRGPHAPAKLEHRSTPDSRPIDCVRHWSGRL